MSANPVVSNPAPDEVTPAQRAVMLAFFDLRDAAEDLLLEHDACGCDFCADLDRISYTLEIYHAALEGQLYHCPVLSRRTAAFHQRERERNRLHAQRRREAKAATQTAAAAEPEPVPAPTPAAPVKFREWL